MNLWEIIMDAANELETGVPGTATVPTLTEFVRWANMGQDIIANKTNLIEDLITLSTVANQTEYTLPTRFIRPIRGEWIEATQSLYKLRYKDIEAYRHIAANHSTGTPEMMTVYNRKLLIFYPVATGAQTTTLSGDHTATVTTITVASSSGFPSYGRIIIDSEVIEYTGSTATTLTGCTRGVEGTTAAAHTSGATITERDIRIYCNVRFKDRILSVYNTGTVLFTNASANITGTSTYLSTNAYPGWQIGTSTNPTKWYDIATLTSATAGTITPVWGEATTTSTYYVAAPIPDIPSEYHDLIKLYLCHRAKQRLEERELALDYYNQFMAGVEKARQENIDRQRDEYEQLKDVDDFG